MDKKTLKNSVSVQAINPLGKEALHEIEGKFLEFEFQFQKRFQAQQQYYNGWKIHFCLNPSKIEALVGSENIGEILRHYLSGEELAKFGTNNNDFASFAKPGGGAYKDLSDAHKAGLLFVHEALSKLISGHIGFKSLHGGDVGDGEFTIYTCSLEGTLKAVELLSKLEISMSIGGNEMRFPLSRILKPLHQKKNYLIVDDEAKFPIRFRPVSRGTDEITSDGYNGIPLHKSHIRYVYLDTTPVETKNELMLLGMAKTYDIYGECFSPKLSDGKLLVNELVEKDAKIRSGSRWLEAFEK
ncbi:MAG: hypothetical protein NT051_03895 [Candidatus Micrarchaeota archaeon]|nr:hypothetical protein [Candidatus Micrarchaeota archaeon]